ncbi:MAG TPA: hypothetical protein VKV79_02315, partial [Terriglobia bacterium]|nr:hypothetical protein [Terriglobia bacterium]
PQGIPIVLNQPGFSKPGSGPVPPTLLPLTPRSIGWQMGGFPGVTVPPTPVPNGRCSEKGCVFPAASSGQGKCLHHYRQASEPVLFSSHQPTRAVLDRGRFGIPEQEVDTSRNRDRRELAAIREAFLED